MATALQNWLADVYRDAPEQAQHYIAEALSAAMTHKIDVSRRRGPLPPKLAGPFAQFVEAQTPNVTQALLSLEIDWRQSTLQGDEAYSNGNSFCQLFGQVNDKGLGAMGGFYLLAPRQFYPNHRHQGVEGYVLLDGDMAWSYYSGPWVEPTKQRQMLITPSNAPHRMQSGARAAITAWVWWGDLDASDWSFCA